MQKLLLMGDEAIAQGAIDAGLSGCYSYPGTPATEIMEYVQASKQAKEKGIFCNWSANEKTAVESALGMSYTGKRAIACMKHVGLNVAADPFVNSAVTGVNGGLIIVCADDPSMHSSQNEQDSRVLAKFAMIPVFEPSNQQEAYDMTFTAFDISEKYMVPVMMRITTRLAHSRSGVTRKAERPQNSIKLPKDPTQFVLLPSRARVRYKLLLNNQQHFENESNQSIFNKYFDGNDKSLGVIASGIAYNYLIENFENQKVPYPVLKISQYPIPRNLIEKITSECAELLILEEGFPMIEEMLKGYLGNCLKIKGRLSGEVPRDGELNPNIVAEALNIKHPKLLTIPEVVVNRPPSLCQGCGHADTFNALNEALTPYGKGRVFSDIGCYTLGALPPFDSLSSCVDMGASVTMAKGAADAGLIPAVTVIGDSTFTHSGITGLLDAVNDKSPITVVILDNYSAAMTGGQSSSGEGKLAKICEGIGVNPEHIRTVIPLKKNHAEMVKVMQEEFAYNGVSVIISQRECIQTATRKKRENKTQK